MAIDRSGFVIADTTTAYHFVFSLIFAISVGISSGNFGTLVRYKIPLMPFYLAGLYIMQSITQPVAKRTRAQLVRQPQPQLA